ncbi:MAG: NAD(P)H-dependent oxidoreductase [Synergistaceae bacterium]|nr:hypothetical protein [Synergistota bacterium]NLM71770.1 NAD(P)H-dependent oxidoreductase [Synergistaceae bacterium]
MLLNVFNCSPRGVGSNTKVLTDAFSEGFLQARHSSGEVNEVREFLVTDPEDCALGLEAFPMPSSALIAFPLYVDAMPAIAKAFIEDIYSYRGRCGSTRMLFLVQSGFPEETHTRVMKDYLEKLAKRMGAPCDGVIRMGGGEAIRYKRRGSKPGKVWQRYQELGRIYGEKGLLDEGILKSLAGVRRVPLLARLFAPRFVNKFLWDRELKRNGAYENRFDRPLEDVAQGPRLEGGSRPAG